MFINLSFDFYWIFCSTDSNVLCGLNIYAFQVGKKTERATRTPAAPPGLFFQHAGHRFKIVTAFLGF